MSGLTAVGAPTRAAAEALARIAADGRSGIWITLLDRDSVMEAAARVEALQADGADVPLAGLTFAVKNNIDVQGVRTTAGCPSFGRVAPAHAPVVQVLVDAGAVVVGVTNLDQFATGLVGTRSPYGVCPNAHWDGLISGGSSSGSAVAVAAGLVDFSLGTDTAGSGRVPAAANGIFGWKPTKSEVPTDGVVPACESLDCVSFFGRDPDLLARVRGVMGRVTPAAPDPARPAPVRLGLPATSSLQHDGDRTWADQIAWAIPELVRRAGAETATVDIEPFLATGRLLYEGAFVRERFDAVGDFIEHHRDDVDPVVYSIIHAAGSLRPEDLERDRQVVEGRARELAPLWREVDAIVVPSVPRVPSIAEVRDEPIAVNAMLGIYTNFVNLLGLCAIAVPLGPPSPTGPPASLTLIAPAGRDDLLLSIAADVAAGDPGSR